MFFRNAHSNPRLGLSLPLRHQLANFYVCFNNRKSFSSSRKTSLISHTKEKQTNKQTKPIQKNTLSTSLLFHCIIIIYLCIFHST